MNKQVMFSNCWKFYGFLFSVWGLILIYIKMSDNSHILSSNFYFFLAGTEHTQTLISSLILNRLMKINRTEDWHRFTVMLQIKHYNTLADICRVAYLQLIQSWMLTPNGSTYYTDVRLWSLFDPENKFWRS